MKIQEAIAAAQEGKLIRRTSWREKELTCMTTIPHYQQHIALEKEGDQHRWVKRDQFEPHALTFNHTFCVSEILAEDWEIIEETCDCVECDPQRYENDPFKIGDLIERWPCSGLRIIWVVSDVNDYQVSGTVYRIFDGSTELQFDIDSSGASPKIKILTPKNGLGYRDWIHGPRQGAAIKTIRLGLLHRWPQFKYQCRLRGERLEQLRRYETQQRIAAIETSSDPTLSRAVAARPIRG